MEGKFDQLSRIQGLAQNIIKQNEYSESDPGYTPCVIKTIEHLLKELEGARTSTWIVIAKKLS